MSNTNISESNSLIPIIVSMAFFVSGMIGAIFVIYYAGIENGVRLILHDPGKYFFHVLLLPASVWVYLNEFPIKLFKQLHKRKRVVIGLFAFLGITAAAIGAFGDHYDGICERVSSPVDFSSEDTRRKLLEIKINGHEEMRKASGTEKFKQASEEALGKYRAILDEIRSGDCDYFELSGPAQFWSLFLSFLGILFVVSVFWLFLVHLLARKKPTSEMFSVYLIIFSLLVPWLLLRAYSEWYLNFGIDYLTNYKTIFIIGFLALVMLVILYFLSLKKQRAQKIAASVISAIATFIGFVSLFKPEWFPFAAQIWHKMDISEMLIMYIIIIPAVGSLFYYVIGPEDSSDSSQS